MPAKEARARGSRPETWPPAVTQLERATFPRGSGRDQDEILRGGGSDDDDDALTAGDDLAGGGA